MGSNSIGDECDGCNGVLFMLFVPGVCGRVIVSWLII